MEVQCTHFSLLSNIVRAEADVKLPFEVGNGIFIKRANQHQAELTKEFLNSHSSYFEKYIQFHERTYSYEENVGMKFSEPHDERNWNYFVIEANYNDNEYHFQELVRCSYLASRILMPMTLAYNDRGLYASNYDDLVINYFYRKMYDASISIHEVMLSNDVLASFKKIYQMYLTVRELKFKFIISAIDNYSLTAQYHKNRDLKIIQFFSIIELLLTHKPGPTEVGDSISRQLSNKTNLINNRLTQQLDLRKFFGPQDHDDEKEKKDIEKKLNLKKVLKDLYQYRSNVAHGNENEFKNELKLLRSEGNANSFLDLELIPKFLKYALKEPLLFQDLKDC